MSILSCRVGEEEHLELLSRMVGDDDDKRIRVFPNVVEKSDVKLSH